MLHRRGNSKGYQFLNRGCKKRGEGKWGVMGWGSGEKGGGFPGDRRKREKSILEWAAWPTGIGVGKKKHHTKEMGGG